MKTLTAFTINLTHKTKIRKIPFPTNLTRWNNSFQFKKEKKKTVDF